MNNILLQNEQSNLSGPNSIRLLMKAALSGRKGKVPIAIGRGGTSYWL